MVCQRGGLNVHKKEQDKVFALYFVSSGTVVQNCPIGDCSHDVSQFKASGLFKQYV